jgi:hypothetical protein
MATKLDGDWSWRPAMQLELRRKRRHSVFGDDALQSKTIQLESTYCLERAGGGLIDLRASCGHGSASATPLPQLEWKVVAKLVTARLSREGRQEVEKS